MGPLVGPLLSLIILSLMYFSVLEPQFCHFLLVCIFRVDPDGAGFQKSVCAGACLLSRCHKLEEAMGNANAARGFRPSREEHPGDVLRGMKRLPR